MPIFEHVAMHNVIPETLEASLTAFFNVYVMKN